MSIFRAFVTTVAAAILMTAVACAALRLDVSPAHASTSSASAVTALQTAKAQSLSSTTEARWRYCVREANVGASDNTALAGDLQIATRGAGEALPSDAITLSADGYTILFAVKPGYKLCAVQFTLGDSEGAEYFFLKGSETPGGTYRYDLLKPGRQIHFVGVLAQAVA